MSATPPRTRAGLRWLLVASLALNVAVLAGVAWHHFDGPRHGPHARHVRSDMMPSPRLLRRALPEARRGVIDAVMDRHGEHIRRSVSAVHDARGAVHALLSADQLDPEALERAFAELRERDAEAAMAVQAMLTEVVSQLTPEERLAVAEAVHRHHHGRPRPRRDTPPNRSP